VHLFLILYLTAIYFYAFYYQILTAFDDDSDKITQGLYRPWKVLELKCWDFQAWKVLEKGIGPGKPWKSRGILK